MDPYLMEIHFDFLGPHPVAGMGEPWRTKIEPTLKALKSLGVGAILTVTEDDPMGTFYRRFGMRHLHVPMDDAEPATDESLDQALSFVDSSLAENAAVAVHCLEGRGRTGMVLGAWLGKTLGLPGDSAVGKLRALRPITALTPAQRLFVIDYLDRRRAREKGV